ncbi:gas vesicle structural protein GvpA [Micromonospora olivasterospora]|uniref:Gas vesicle protein A n=1 Tax=Micromonospora olivasterospora TaxID=1880 RepID=A0A562IEB4_MICOL|nr:gas vesicle structural protein GvpA [Micromonospora olivasterospora]TWH69075.1 gas vesicle protein GvpA/GvpJ/GvpM family [Micromonospora olivasterospora]
MTVTSTGANRAPRPSSLADVLDLILDKGIVIDAYVRVSLVGIELLTIDARVVIASVDTYLRFAEAVNRLDLQPEGQVTGLPGLIQSVTEGGARAKTRGALGGVRDTVSEIKQKIRGDDDAEDDDGGHRRRRLPVGRQASGRQPSARSNSGDEES